MSTVIVSTLLPLLDMYACKYYNACMQYINVRIRKDTQRKLKIVAALLDEKMLDTLERLVTQELDRVQKGHQNTTQQKDQAPHE